MLLPSVRMAQLGRRRAAAAGYSCNLTIGNFSAAIYGYSTADGAFGAFGSISAEPISGEALLAAFWLPDGSILAVYFYGDVTSLVSTLNVWVNGVNYGGAGSWTYISGDGVTELILGAGPTLTSGTYLLEFK